MKGFIIITEKYDGVKMLYPTERIMSVIDNDAGGAFIETVYDGKGESMGICTVETFDEIKEKIEQSED